MTENKKEAQNIELQNNFNNNIIPDNIVKNKQHKDFPHSNWHENSLKMPKILDEITFKFAKTLYPDMTLTCALGFVLTLVGSAFSHKRIKFDEYANGENVRNFNIYLINIVLSGGGKDKLRTYVEEKVLQPILDYIKTEAENYIAALKEKVHKEAEAKAEPAEKKTFLKEELAKIRDIEFIICNATPEGFYEDAKAISQMPIGALFCIIAELGLFINDKDDKKMQMLSSLYPAYDGEIIAKSIKTENREKNLSGVVVNALLYSDPSSFKGKHVSAIFEYLLQTGLARRAFVTFQDNSNMTIKNDPNAEYQRHLDAFEHAKNIKKELFEIFKKVPANAAYKLPKEVSLKVFHPYKVKITNLYNATTDPMIKKEIKSRELKALMLATLCACLNHPQHFEIDKTDFEQGICLTELLSADFQKFNFFMNERKDSYSKFFDFLVENSGKKFTKTYIVNEHYKDFGMKREELRKNSTWKETIGILSEMANLKGYVLHTEEANGWKILLDKVLSAETLPNNFQPLDEIIS